MSFSHPTGILARRTTILMAAMACACQVGCVQRRMVVRSNPPGAVVYVDDYEIGTTPVATNFTYYGTRKIRLVKNGYETLTVMQPIPVPWYQITPIDFFAENMVPGKIHDTRTLDYQLVPQLVAPSEQLLDRAEGLRRQTRAAGMVQTSPPLRAAPPPGNPSIGVAPSAIPRAASPSPGAPQTLSPAPSSGLPPTAWPLGASGSQG